VICSYCNNEAFKPGLINLTFERDGITVVVRDIPALVCTRCNEGVVDSDVADQVLDEVEEAVSEGKMEITFKQAA
jgi:YgiT-type zinc finger domain-containing protein